MSDAKLFLITGFGGGVSAGIQADSPEEFAQLVANVRALAAQDLAVSRLFGPLIGTDAPGVNAAVGVVQAAFPQAQPVSTVGQPLPQPVPQPVVQQGPSVPPPTVVNPGNCAHGARVYVDKPARGKPWRRWECAVPWSKGAVGRCDPINVEAA